jgi:hypothetical protein
MDDHKFLTVDEFLQLIEEIYWKQFNPKFDVTVIKECTNEYDTSIL